MTLQFGATALICAKAPAVLPTVAFVPLVEGQKLSWHDYEKSFDLPDILPGALGPPHFESNWTRR